MVRTTRPIATPKLSTGSRSQTPLPTTAGQRRPVPKPRSYYDIESTPTPVRTSKPLDGASTPGPGTSNKRPPSSLSQCSDINYETGVSDTLVGVGVRASTIRKRTRFEDDEDQADPQKNAYFLPPPTQDQSFDKGTSRPETPLRRDLPGRNTTFETPTIPSSSGRDPDGTPSVPYTPTPAPMWKSKIPRPSNPIGNQPTFVSKLPIPIVSKDSVPPILFPDEMARHREEDRERLESMEDIFTDPNLIRLMKANNETPKQHPDWNYRKHATEQEAISQEEGQRRVEDPEGIGMAYKNLNKRTTLVGRQNEEEDEDPDPYRGYPSRETNITEEADWESVLEDMERQGKTNKMTLTQLALYLWVTTGNVSKEAYQIMMKLQRKEWWSVKDCPLSYTTIRDMRHLLPTDTIYNHEVDIKIEEGDSSTK